MAFRTQQSPAAALALAKNRAGQVKGYCTILSGQISSTVNRDVVTSAASTLKGYRDELDVLKTVQGLAQYARDQENDQAYDVAAEFNALVAAIDAVIAEIFLTYPTANPSGAVIERVLNADGSVTPLTFTSAQLASVKTLVDAVVVSID